MQRRKDIPTTMRHRNLVFVSVLAKIITAPVWCAGWVSVAMFAIAATSRAHAADCTRLAALKLPHVTITLAEPVAAAAFQEPPPGFGRPRVDAAKLPAFCRVAATARPTPDSDIRFEVWMPLSHWNGKYMGGGNGVWAGTIPYDNIVPGLVAGYAAAATDMGHQGSPLDASFAAGHPEKLVDFGHRAVHETTVAAKRIVKAFYGKPAS